MLQVRRAFWLGFAVLIGGYAAFAILLLATPSVTNARQLAMAQDREHLAVYPGPAVPAKFAAALEATEDHRFNTEPGIDPIAVARFVLGEISGQGDTGGATLYQQLAKLLYTNGQPSLGMEADQVALGIKLRFKYGPAEVLRLYSAVVYFGHQFYGLKAASCGYFGVLPARMSWPQAALLAGLVYDPTIDDPLVYPARGMQREEHVIGRLVAVGALTQQQADQALKVPMGKLLVRAGQGCGRTAR
jgi:membrane peptidoglycan carboxypeptidase